MSNSINPFTWKPTFSDFKKNIIEDDIIPDELLEGIKNKIKSYCPANYRSYTPSANVGHTTSCNDTGGTSNCNCDIQGTYGYPADCKDGTDGTKCGGIFETNNAEYDCGSSGSNMCYDNCNKN